jgi:hypothetical protein
MQTMHNYGHTRCFAVDGNSNITCQISTGTVTVTLNQNDTLMKNPSSMCFLSNLA